MALGGFGQPHVETAHNALKAFLGEGGSRLLHDAKAFPEGFAELHDSHIQAFRNHQAQNVVAQKLINKTSGGNPIMVSGNNAG